ncbi:hypothetical protein [Heyndrickxia oleronia]|uniref:hypothetical protein n=1 Tax=Heyndrickxia oleronia TaxID=38875 RepID=UPI001B1D2250|nr:hypothetical protein [Heyndrickxia oleronia]GIN38446.1 hypothetical protein J19TS1_13950 [Heyndrickxia oleronia]
MNSIALKRLENNRYSLEKAFERLKNAIKQREEQEIYAAIGETLLWFLTTEEWHKKHNRGYKKRKESDENGEILFGLLHAYNSMKHNMEFMTIHKRQGGFRFPMAFPVSFPHITVHWIKSDNVLEEGYPTQKRNYKNYIEGRDVLQTFELALEFLESEYEKIIK